MDDRVRELRADRVDPSLPLAFRIAEVFELPIERIFRPEPADAR